MKILKYVIVGSLIFLFSLEGQAQNTFDSLKLGRLGLGRIVWDYAMLGFNNLKEQGVVDRDIITIADFSQGSNKKRLFVIDLKNHKLLYNTYVAHGRNSGYLYASNFSNQEESYKSSIGFYVTGVTYPGSHGISLKLRGLEQGFNCNAEKRLIVMHGASYVGDGYMGRSLGCPALPIDICGDVIERIKNNTVLFIYANSGKYIQTSKLLK